MSGHVYEVYERQQPHNQGWPEPPPLSHGLFSTAQAAQEKTRELAEGPLRILATHVIRRAVHGGRASTRTLTCRCPGPDGPQQQVLYCAVHDRAPRPQGRILTGENDVGVGA